MGFATASPTLVLGAIVPLLIAALFAYAALLVRGRHAEGARQRALVAWSTWWLGAAAVFGLNGLQTLAGLLGFVDPFLHTTFHYLRALPIVIALAGLAYYIRYLYTGKEPRLVPFVFAYLLVYLLSLAYFVSLAPDGVEITDWEVRARAHPERAPLLSILFAVALAVPILGGLGLYASLFFRLREPTPRYRVGLVSAGLGIFFLTILVGFLLRLEREPWFPIAYELAGLVSAAMVVLAYRPPAFVRRRWGIEALR